MQASKCVGCEELTCADVKHDCYIIPDINVKPDDISIVMISEAAPANPRDYYYAKGDPLFQQTTVQAFKDAGADVSSMQDVVDSGVYLTTAVKCGKRKGILFPKQACFSILPSSRSQFLYRKEQEKNDCGRHHCRIESIEVNPIKTERKEKMNDDLKSNSLVDMVDYQKEAVVSKTIIEKKTGTVTLFAFDQGQGLSEHTAPFDALVQVLDGEVEIKISGNPFHLKRGEMIIMPANKPHALKAVRQFKMLLTMIRS